jgi:hypothetical protein
MSPLYQTRVQIIRMRIACVIVVEELMPRFYFHLTSKDSHIPDDAGKELDSLNDAYEHAWALIYKILFHIGDDDAKGWKVVISNEEHDAQIIVPFPASSSLAPPKDRAKNLRLGRR